ncbi:MAG: hypothetical protein GXX11_09730 [Acholeplasmataceae bacterium]|nr:hypothetical protein [Acholeplasmataceae bacterium]
MAKNEKQSQTETKKIYIKSKKLFIPVSVKIYYEYYRPIWALRKKAQQHAQCLCPYKELWTCDGECAICEHRAPGDLRSLDYTFTNSIGVKTCLLDILESEDSEFESIIDNKLVAIEAWSYLSKAAPFILQVATFKTQGLTDKEIAKRLGIPRTTLLSKIKALRISLQEKFPELNIQ